MYIYVYVYVCVCVLGLGLPNPVLTLTLCIQSYPFRTLHHTSLDPGCGCSGRNRFCVRRERCCGGSAFKPCNSIANRIPASHHTGTAHVSKNEREMQGGYDWNVEFSHVSINEGAIANRPPREEMLIVIAPPPLREKLWHPRKGRIKLKMPVG